MKHLLVSVKELVAKFAVTRVNGKVASDRTTTSCGETLHTSFKDLDSLGYKLQDPKNLSNKHVSALCQHWHAKGIAVSTMQERLSRLRIFCGWIGKKGMVKSLPHYLPDVDPSTLRVRKVARKSKSWTENGLDVAEKIEEADALDPRFGLMLRMTLAFGLRRMEVVQIRPWKSDKGDKLAVYQAKNGRPRDVYIETPEQRQVLDLVKAQIGKSQPMGWMEKTSGQTATLKYSIGRYNKSMLAIGITREVAGVTGHGLRAQFAENAALIAHVIPPTLGGTGGQMPRDELNVKLTQISELLGHSRIHITAAYLGSLGREATKDEVDRCKNNVDNALQGLDSKNMPSVPTARLLDCLQIVGEMSLIDVELTPRQANFLWELHSKRHACEWVKPRAGNAEAIEAAAIFVLKNNRE